MPPWNNYLDIPSKQNRPKQQHKSTRLRPPSPLQRSLSPPEESPNSGRSSRCPDARGPADLPVPSRPCDGAPPPAGWVVDGWQQGGFLCHGETGLLLWSATGERQCVGDAVWHIDCSNTKTCKSQNGGKWWEPRSQGEGFSCTAWSWHTLSMHQPKL